MLIYLLRHGIADQRAVADATRELSREGITQTREVVEKFKLYEPFIERAYMSSLQRARQTAGLLRPALPNLRFDVDRNLEPDGDVYKVFESIEKSPVQNLMLVSHNPLLSNLLSLMLDGTLESSRHFAESHLYCIEMDVVAPGCGTIKYVLEP